MEPFYKDHESVTLHKRPTLIEHHSKSGLFREVSLHKHIQDLQISFMQKKLWRLSNVFQRLYH